MKRIVYAFFAAGLILAATGLLPASVQDARTAGEKAEWTPLPGPGKKVKINEDYSFTYEFSQRPQMGTVILVVRVVDSRGNKVVPFKITGRSDMPSMRGAHDSGEVEFKTNKALNYLLPVNIVMPGEWEVQLSFSLEGKAAFRGAVHFSV